MPLLTISGIKNDGTTIILGYAFLEDETFELKKWALDNFIKFNNGIKPLSSITDACPTLMKATEEVFVGSSFFLCSWHAQLNLKKHLSGLKKKLQKNG